MVLTACKVYYDLLSARRKAADTSSALILIEQLYQLPVYPWVIFGRAVGWILDDRAHEPTVAKAKALAHLAFVYPASFTRGLVRFARGPLRKPAPGSGS